MELPSTLNINRTTYYSEKIVRDSRVTGSAKKVARSHSGIMIYHCSACDQVVKSSDNYCGKCGRKF